MIQSIIRIGQGQLYNAEGFMDISLQGRVITMNGVEYVYHSSGMLREVYISPCKTYVLKIPKGGHKLNGTLMMRGIQSLVTGTASYVNDLSVTHNYYEWKCYNDAPMEYRKYLAKTELLENGWLKQEYCEVHKCIINSDFREVGIDSAGNAVMFDYDLLLESDKTEPIGGFTYDKLVHIFETLVPKKLKELGIFI